MPANDQFYKVVRVGPDGSLYSCNSDPAAYGRDPWMIRYQPGEVTLPVTGSRLFVFSMQWRAEAWSARIPALQIWRCLAIDPLPWRYIAPSRYAYETFWWSLDPTGDGPYWIPAPDDTHLATAVVLLERLDLIPL